MYRMGIICMLCPPDAGIDKDRCVKMALIHDMAEALVGDITPPDNVGSGEWTRFISLALAWADHSQRRRGAVSSKP